MMQRNRQDFTISSKNAIVCCYVNLVQFLSRCVKHLDRFESDRGNLVTRSNAEVISKHYVVGEENGNNYQLP